jgi:hypothetical protein
VRRVCIAALLVAFTLASPASAQIFGGRRQDEMIADLQRQISELQALVSGAGETRGLVAAQTATQSEVSAAKTRVDDLEATLRTLNGRWRPSPANWCRRGATSPRRATRTAP